MFFAFILLLSALSISAVAAYYSIAGLTAIFAAAFWPIVIMGSVLEVGKIMTTVWLHVYWKRIPLLAKTYLSSAVLVLMFVTSMGIFGFLSKAHIEQTSSAGNQSLQIELIDSKIAREQKRITDAETVIDQLDAAVETLAKYDRIRGPDGSIAVRESQKEERASLSAIINEASESVAAMREERLVLSKQQVALEAEVGPIKYIAELIYGTSPDASLLEAAVRWVIIIIVAVFDPLAIMLVLAAAMTFEWSRSHSDNKNHVSELVARFNKLRHIYDIVIKQKQRLQMEILNFEKLVSEIGDHLDQLSKVSTTAIDYESSTLELYREKNEIEQKLSVARTELQEADELSETLRLEIESLRAEIKELTDREPEIVEVENTARIDQLISRVAELEREVDKKDTEISKRDAAIIALADRYDLVPKTDADELAANSTTEPATGFGVVFPESAQKGDYFLRTDFSPIRLYQWSGIKWSQVDQSTCEAMVNNAEYLQHMAKLVAAGTINLAELPISDTERSAISELSEKLANEPTGLTDE
jgi:hypothetical protein